MFVDPLSIDNIRIFFKGVEFAQYLNESKIIFNLAEMKDFESFLNSKYSKLEFNLEWHVVVRDQCPDESKQISWFFSEWKNFKLLASEKTK